MSGVSQNLSEWTTFSKRKFLISGKWKSEWYLVSFRPTSQTSCKPYWIHYCSLMKLEEELITICDTGVRHRRILYNLITWGIGKGIVTPIFLACLNCNYHPYRNRRDSRNWITSFIHFKDHDNIYFLRQEKKCMKSVLWFFCSWQFLTCDGCDITSENIRN